MIMDESLASEVATLRRTPLKRKQGASGCMKSENEGTQSKAETENCKHESKVSPLSAAMRPLRRTASVTSAISRSLSRKFERPSSETISYSSSSTTALSITETDELARKSSESTLTSRPRLFRSASAVSLGHTIGRGIERSFSAASHTLIKTVSEVRQLMNPKEGSKELLPAMDWKLKSQVYPYLVQRFQTFKEFDYQPETSTRFVIVGGIPCAVSVVEVQTSEEFIYVTSGLANLFLVHQGSHDIGVNNRERGHEIIFRIRKDRSLYSVGYRAKHPKWPQELLFWFIAKAAANPAVNFRHLDYFACPPSLSEFSDFDGLVLCNVDFAFLDDLWAPFSDVHGTTSHLVVVGLSPLEASQFSHETSPKTASENLKLKRDLEGHIFATSKLNHC